ncbi:hypothetical protein FGB62_266g07 [Gracilaria domingensis]|nr:hypothetical protein FGB62_266g07 [Gracilaria domingensis]
MNYSNLPEGLCPSNQSDNEPDALTTRHSASAPTLSTRIPDVFVPDNFELPVNRELAHGNFGPEAVPYTPADNIWLRELLDQHVHNDLISPMETTPSAVNAMGADVPFSSPVSALDGGASAGGSAAQDNAVINGATPASTSPFSISSSPSSAFRSLEQQGSNMGYAAPPNILGAQGNGVRIVPSRSRVSVNANDGTAGGGSRTEPCTPLLGHERSSRLMSEEERQLEERLLLRRRKKAVVDSIKPYVPLSADMLRRFVGEQGVASTKNEIKDAIESMAEIQKETLRDKIRELSNVSSNSRESSVSRKKEECILFGYKKVLNLLVDLLYERESGN